MSAKDEVVSISECSQATIESGQSLSNEVKLGGLKAFALSLPSPFTGTVLTFMVACSDTAPLKKLLSKGVEYTETVEANGYVVLDPTVFASVRRMAIRSGTTSSPVVQAQASVIDVVLRTL